MNILEQKMVKTRKPHRCWGCRREFPKGSILEYTRSVDEEGFNNCYWCDTCRDLWNYRDLLEVDSYEGIGFGEFMDIAPSFDSENVEELLDYCRKESN